MIEVFEEFTLINQIYNYPMLKFGRFYRGSGTFTLLLNTLKDKEDLLHDRYIVVDGECYIIENIHSYKNNKNEHQLEITGHHINALAKRRIVDSVAMSTTKTVEEQLRQLVESTFISPAIPERKIEEISLKKPQNILIYPLSDYTVTGENGGPLTVEQALNTICSYSDLGWRFLFSPDDKKIYFEIYQGKDRTSKVIFDEQYGNVSTSDLYDNRANYANVFYQDGTFSGVESGINRREVILTDGETANDYKRILSADTAIIDGGSFEYRKDWDVGDTVTFVDDLLGYTVTRPILSVIETHEKSVTIDVVFGDKVPIVYDKFKKR